jgi:hypothetical protein
MSDSVLSASEEDMLLQAPVKMNARLAAEAEKLIGNSAVDRSRQISGFNPLRV